MTRLGKLASLVHTNRRTERRGARRMPVLTRSPCVFTYPTGERIEGTMFNLSGSGIGLLSPRPTAVGDVIGVLLVNPSHTYCLSIRVRVARCGCVAGGDYYVGAEFAQPVSHADLIPFLV